MEIAIFPIPDMVALPGQSHKVHVFEPRYRDMIQECFDNNLLVGLALPVKTISSLDPLTDPQSLNTNLEIYKAADVMGAGSPTLLQTLEDGRMVVRVDITYRVKVRQMTQYLPYYKAEVSVLPDVCGDPRMAADLVEDILELSGVILTKEISIGGPVAGVIQHRVRAIVLWVCSWFELDARDRQYVLECETVVQQAEFLLEKLAEFVRVHGLVIPPHEHKRLIRRDGNLIEVDFHS